LNKKSIHRGSRNKIAAHITTVLLILIIMSPFLWLVQMSFKTPNQIFTMPPKFIFMPTFQNYIDLFKESAFFRH